MRKQGKYEAAEVKAKLGGNRVCALFYLAKSSKYALNIKMLMKYQAEIQKFEEAARIAAKIRYAT